MIITHRKQQNITLRWMSAQIKKCPETSGKEKRNLLFDPTAGVLHIINIFLGQTDALT